MSEIVSFGEWIQKRRNQLHYSRNGLARKVGCAPVTIKKIERDERRPSLEIANLLAKHLEIPESQQEKFIRRARGEFVARFGSPLEMTLAEAQEPATETEAPQHNLPQQMTPFIGRDAELAKIAIALADPDCRLLTILGTGGMGKTRLCIEAAEAQLASFTDGIVYVSLTPIAESPSGQALNPIAGALADALKISFHGGAPPEEQLFGYLGRKEMLIIFDNFEHLLEKAVFLSSLLVHAPDVKILVTSRERLNLQEEWLFPLQGLSYSKGELNALQLFEQRARQVKASFNLASEEPAVMRICQLVEGMPLGLELAAAWVRQMPCQEIADEIEVELDFLTTNLRNVPARHRSMRMIFTHAWQKLAEKEQLVLQQLSVFRGGFDRAAAQAVAGASLNILSSLVDKSLLNTEENGRYNIHELLRQFSTEKLAQNADIEDNAHLQHCRYFFSYVSEHGFRMTGAQALNALQTLEFDIDNVRTAIRWGVNHQIELFDQEFGIGLWRFYEVKGWFLEGEQLIGFIVTQLENLVENDQAAKNRNLSAQASILWVQYSTHQNSCLWRMNRRQEAVHTLEHCLSILPSDDDPIIKWTRSWGLLNLGMAASQHQSYLQAQSYLEESHTLALDTDDFWLQAMSAICWGQSIRANGDYDKAQPLLEKVISILNQLNDRIWTSFVLSDLGRIAMHRGDYATAAKHHRACLLRRQEMGMRSGIATALDELGNVLRLQGEFEAARDCFQRGASVAEELNMIGNVNNILWSLGNLALAESDYSKAAHHFRASGFSLSGDRFYLGGPAWVALGLKDWEEARQIFEVVLKAKTAAIPTKLDALVGLAHLGFLEGQFTRSVELLTLVKNHSACSYEIRQKADKLWKELAAELSAELIAVAEARGRELDLFETAEALLAQKA